MRYKVILNLEFPFSAYITEQALLLAIGVMHVISVS